MAARRVFLAGPQGVVKPRMSCADPVVAVARGGSVAERDAVFARLAAADQRVVAHEHGLTAPEADGLRVADRAMAAARERRCEGVQRLLQGKFPLTAPARVEAPARLVQRGL